MPTGDYPSTDMIMQELAAEQSAAAESASQEQSAPAASPQQTAPEQQQTAREWEIPWNGARIKAGEDQVLKWASQGYDYSQKMQEFKSQKEEYDANFGRYREIDNFVKTNPGWWEHVEKTWNERQNYNVPPEVKQFLDPIQQELQQMKQFQNEWHKMQLEADIRKQDEQLKGVVNSLQTKHNIDFSARDQSGQTLEYRVLQHAQQKGISDFSAAFHDYYQDSLAKLYEARGREAVQRETQARNKAGLLGGPTQAPQPKNDAPVVARSYDDAYQMALKELGY